MTTATADPASSSSSSSSYIFYFFSASWCQHCRNVAGLWDEIRNNHSNSQDSQIQFIQVDCSDRENAESRQKMDEYSVSSFPTFLLVNTDTGTRLKYDDQMDAPAMEAFLKTATAAAAASA